MAAVLVLLGILLPTVLKAVVSRSGRQQVRLAILTILGGLALGWIGGHLKVLMAYEPALPDTGCIPDKVLRHYRLGNLLHAWWSTEICREASTRCEQKEGLTDLLRSELTGIAAPRCTLGSFLRLNPPPIVSAGSRASAAYWQKPVWWWESYEVWKDIHKDFQQSMQSIVQRYLEVTPALRVPYYHNTTCVVHYRLGDMLWDSRPIDPLVMAKSASLWATENGLRITTFVILCSGNILHNVVHDYDQFALTGREVEWTEGTKLESWLKWGIDHRLKGSARIIDSFCRALKQHFGREVRIRLDGSGSADEDFLKMVTAPMLLTAHGSYAITAAAVSTGLRATPNCRNLANPEGGSRQALKGHTMAELAPGWWAYDCVAMVNYTVDGS
mmetsp:Transcript_35628/g.55632  ORF Transcript_35628/g.55632 Transcript_35628/m.55632 type:complete len:386 (+) Transcript_35628:25-1182(+)